MKSNSGLQASSKWASIDAETESRSDWNTKMGAIDLGFALRRLSELAHIRSRRSGFWDGGPDNLSVAAKIALIHSELSEALEGIREGNPASTKIPEFSLLEEELADAIIRICDLAGHLDLRIGEAIKAKMEYNSTRPRMHGKRF